MPEHTTLSRFLDAQQKMYATALSEITAGRKQTHWMWFIFPQIQGLGFSETSRYYAIKDIKEASAFLQHPILGSRLITISTALQQLKGITASKILGIPDDLKLQSSMTLFAALPDAHLVFQAVLEKFFSGKKDEKTQRILERNTNET